MRFIFSLLGLLLVSLPALSDPVTVRVGGYLFPPYMQSQADGEWSGLTPDVLQALNALQDDIHFELFPTSANRRYLDFANGQFDMMLFESPHWGWQDYPVYSVKGPVVGREVFIAKTDGQLDQRYFHDLEGKRIALFSGYHYAFAGFNPDKNQLRERFSAIITFSHESNIQMVLRGRADLSIVSDAYLDNYLRTYPQYRSQLLVSDFADQSYDDFFLVRNGVRPYRDELEAYVRQLQESGRLGELMDRYRLEP
ncbi:MAG: amino acid ABC transporter substrate-binding protein [Gammaproteobacteria bacterium HGW-Gammaproteobacteria-6]|nr:MAG: amino acid ABC transporter substrate-binding protein [Gammaproteobacteria bacterium HGW-Gammaproteobacteria-6]